MLHVAGILSEADPGMTRSLPMAGEPVVSAYRSLGARDCVPIYNAPDPETHFPVPGEEIQGNIWIPWQPSSDREERVKSFPLCSDAS